MSALLATLSFPPLYTPERVAAGVDPFGKALSAAALEAEAGRLVYADDSGAMRAAVTLAPELPLSAAMGAVLAAELGLADAIGALGPPEVAVHFVWPDRLSVNGALCGSVRAAASTADPKAEPDWLIVGVDVPVAAALADPGTQPDQTALHEEGCVDVGVAELLEAWSRHTLVWLNTLTDDGHGPLHRAWTAKCDEIGAEVTEPEHGLFVGLDVEGGMLLRRGAATRLIPLTVMLER